MTSDEQHIERYLAKELSEEERVRFQQRMETEPGFAEQVEAQSSLHELVIQEGLWQLEDQMKADLAGKSFASKKGRGHSRWLLLGLVPLAAISIWLLVKPQEDELSAGSNDRPPPVTDVSPTEQATIVEPLPVEETSGTAAIQKPSQGLRPSNEPATPEVMREKNTSDSILVTQEEEPGPTVLIDTLATQVLPVSSPVEMETEKMEEVEPCTFLAQSDIEATWVCGKDANGEIALRELNGGEAPYALTLRSEEGETDMGLGVSDAFLFGNLKNGSYTIEIKDARGCSAELEEIVVEQKACDLRFSPSFDREIAIPTKGEAGVLTIYSSGESSIFQQQIDLEQEHVRWDGVTRSGEKAPNGYYVYIIKYTSGRVQKGSITVF